MKEREQLKYGNFSNCFGTQKVMKDKKKETASVKQHLTQMIVI